MIPKIKCPKCGHMNSAGADHCSNCGYKLKQTKQASAVSFLQSMYKTAMACPRAAGDVELNTKNRDKTIERHNYGPLNLSDNGYWEFIADKWNTTSEVAKKSKCGNCVAFDVSPRMDDCMPGPVSDGEGRLGYCWMHHFKCHSARTCNTWAKGGPIKKDEASHDWQKKAKGMEKEAFYATNKEVAALVGIPAVIGSGATMAHNIRNDRDLTDNVGKGALYGAGIGLGGTLFNHGLKLDRAGIPSAIPYIGGSALGGYLATKEASAVKPLVIGGGLFGAGVGALADEENRLRGAAIGGGLGALGGYVGGKAVDHMVDTDPGVIRARAGAAKAEADLQQTIAESKARSEKLDADLAEAKKKTERAKEVTKQIKARLEQVNADEKAGKISPMEASARRVKILEEMSGTEKKAAAGEYDDSHMLSKILERMSAQSAHLKEKIDAGLILPSWAEYKLYGAYDGLGKALGTAYPGKYDLEKEGKFLPGDFSMATAKSLGNALRKTPGTLPKPVSTSIVRPANPVSSAVSDSQARLKDIMSKYNENMASLRSLHNKTASSVATKTDPATWEAAKREAKSKMGGKHSARAMQLATKIYKDNGGGYSGAKPTSSTNSLKKWTKQDWGYSGKDKPGQGGSGVYLPKRRRDVLKSTKQGRKQLAAATRKKHKATAQGQQYSSHGLAAGTSLTKKAEDSQNKAISGLHYMDMHPSITPAISGLLGAGVAYADDFGNNSPRHLAYTAGFGGLGYGTGKIIEKARLKRKQEKLRTEAPKNKKINKTASIEYRGRTFPGYNQPIASDKKDKKKMVLAKKDGKVKLIHFGQEGYQHNYSKSAKKNYLTRSAGIRNKAGELTMNDKHSPNYWSRKHLWPKQQEADGTELKKKASSRVISPDAYYAPSQVSNPHLPMPIDQGNQQVVQEQLMSMQQPPKNMFAPPPPSIQNNTPMPLPRIPTKITGM